MPTNPEVMTIGTPEGKVVQGFNWYWDTYPYVDDFREKMKPEQRSQATNQLHLPI